MPSLNASFGTEVTGPLLAKHFAESVAPGGSFLFMSGVTALKPAPGMLAVAALANGYLTGVSIPSTAASTSSERRGRHP